jgi:protocatechuate 3,4-dioxygenase beta subunit
MKLNFYWMRPWRSLPSNRWVFGFTIVALFVLCMTASTAHAQQGSATQAQKQHIQGRVTDANGKPLQDVSVKVKGSNKGVVTNGNGEYTIDLSGSSSKVLEFSFVGMDTREVKAGTQQEINISLSAASVSEQEVVVVGYGTQKKQAVTGAVVKADLKTYENVTVNNIMETLKGTVGRPERG